MCCILVLRVCVVAWDWISNTYEGGFLLTSSDGWFDAVMVVA